MELMQDWWKSNLAEEINSSLLLKETKLPQFCVKSPQLSSRRCLVDWLAVVCDNYRVCRTARHLTITLLDYFMDRYVIVEEKLKLVGIGCLLVAAKFEDQEIRIPKAIDLNQYVCSPGYTMATYLKMELMLLDTFDWKISFPTAAHFAEYFTTAAVLDEDELQSNQSVVDADKIKTYMDKYVDYFLEISLQDHTYREYKPSLVCAACIASSRICLRVSPPWNKKLQKQTQYTWQDLQSLVQVMQRTYSLDEKTSQTGQCNMIAQVSPVSAVAIPSSSLITQQTPITPITQTPFTTIGQVSTTYNYTTQHAWMMYVQ